MSEQAQAIAPTVANYISAAALSDAVAAALAGAIGRGIAARGSATLVLSGGGTPGPAYGRLFEMDLPWQAVTLTLADDRCVPEDSPASNAGMVNALRAETPAAAARFVPLYAPGSAGSCNPDVSALPRPFDAVLLGMGEDGHTASLFPHAAGLAAALDPDGEATCVSLTPDPLPDNAPYPRVTLTAAALADAGEIMLLLVGADKLAVYKQAMADGDAEAMPVRAVLRQRRAPVTVYYAEKKS
ncbi:MAG: 6-phosphogluconolactonase [Gammaproteobacteria bacterium]|nr:6-phosphogluconolactonase [Gammaproteobacteria bacterium]NNM00977.1 6-phosphogluconolactonase [Gammaproteobacteria bacterium]